MSQVQWVYERQLKVVGSKVETHEHISSQGGKTDAHRLAAVFPKNAGFVWKWLQIATHTQVDCGRNAVRPLEAPLRLHN
jgi:hypothetical protein